MGEEETSRQARRDSQDYALEMMAAMDEAEDAPRRKTGLHEARARRRQMTYFQKRREEKKRQVFFNRIRALVRVLFAGVLIYGLYALVTAPFWIYAEPSYSVVNQHLLNPEALKPLVQAYQGRPMDEVDPGALAKGIQQQFPIVDQVYVRRFLFPNRLALSVLEKTPWAEVFDSPQAPQPYALMTQDLRQRYGVVALQQPALARKQYNPQQMVKIILTPGQPLSPQFLRSLDVLSYQLKAVPGLTFESLDATQPSGLTAHFKEVGVRIGRLDSETEGRLARLLPLVGKIQELTGKVDWVDLRWSHQVTFHKAKASSLNGTQPAADITVSEPDQGHGVPTPGAVKTVSTVH